MVVVRGWLTGKLRRSKGLAGAVDPLLAATGQTKVGEAVIAVTSKALKMQQV